MFDDQPTVVIQGRAPARDIAYALKFLREQADFTPATRSELVRGVFDAVRAFAKMNGVEDFDSNHDAMEYLARFGLGYAGEHHQKDVQKTLAFDVFKDMTYEEAMAFKQQMRSRGQVSNDEVKEQHDNFLDSIDLDAQLDEVDRRMGQSKPKE